MKELRKEREVLVGATFYVDKVDPSAENLPDLLRDKFEQEVDRNKIFFSICIPGDKQSRFKKTSRRKQRLKISN